jgi:tetratricopeptide (TPR) repeat protein
MGRNFLSISAMLLAFGFGLPAQNGGNTDQLIQQARNVSREGNYDEAIKLYQRAIESSPNSFEAQLGLGTALDLNGQYSTARQHLSKAIELANERQKPQALRSMAMSYAFEGKAGEASKYERQVFDARLAAEDYTGAAEIANELARLYLESGDLDNAYKWYETGHDTAFRRRISRRLTRTSGTSAGNTHRRGSRRVAASATKQKSMCRLRKRFLIRAQFRISSGSFRTWSDTWRYIAAIIRKP